MDLEIHYEAKEVSRVVTKGNRGLAERRDDPHRSRTPILLSRLRLHLEISEFFPPPLLVLLEILFDRYMQLEGAATYEDGSSYEFGEASCDNGPLTSKCGHAGGDYCSHYICKPHNSVSHYITVRLPSPLQFMLYPRLMVVFELHIAPPSISISLSRLRSCQGCSFGRNLGRLAFDSVESLAELNANCLCWSTHINDEFELEVVLLCCRF